MTGVLGATSAWLRRDRRKPVQALLGVLGVAGGVALAYAVGATNSTLTDGYPRLQHELAGRAQLEVVARGPAGLPQSLVHRLRRVRDVMAAAPSSESDVRLRHGGHVLEVRLFGVDQRVRTLGGRLASAVPATADERALGLHLPEPVARSLGVGVGSAVDVESGGSASATAVADVLSESRAGALTYASAAVAPLSLAQELTHSVGRVQRVLVRARPGARGVERALAAATGPDALVRPVGADVRFIEQASRQSTRAASLFAALSLALGGLLAYCAMVVAATQRRREVAVLRTLGCGSGALLAAATAEALLVGCLGAVLGILVGRLALVDLLEPGTRHLASAFVLAPATSVPVTVAGASIVAGVLTSVAASALPARALARVPPAAALQREPEAATAIAGAPPAWLAIASLGLMGCGLVLELAAGAMPGIALWVSGGMLLVPLVLPAIAGAVRRRLPEPGAPSQVGLAEAAAFPARGAAIACVIALTVSCVILFGGGIADLERGTGRLADSTFGRGDLWMRVPGRDNVFLTRPFAARLARRVTRLPFVHRATPLRAAFMDWGERRVYVFGFDFGSGGNLTRGEIVRGNPAALASDPAAVAISDELARARGLELGERFRLPTPTGARPVRLVATLTNYGWEPGAVAVGGASFAGWWRQRDIGALALTLDRGVPVALAESRIRASLRGTGLEVTTPPELRAGIEAAAGAGLTVLRRMAWLVALAGLLATSAAALTGVLQRVPRIATLRAIGTTLPQLASALLAEIVLLLAVGLAVGIPTGIAGQALAVHHLEASSSFPISFDVTAGPLLAASALVVVIAGSATLLPLRWAARVPLGRALRDA